MDMTGPLHEFHNVPFKEIAVQVLRQIDAQHTGTGGESNPMGIHETRSTIHDPHALEQAIAEMERPVIERDHRFIAGHYFTIQVHQLLHGRRTWSRNVLNKDAFGGTRIPRMPEAAAASISRSRSPIMIEVLALRS